MNLIVLGAGGQMGTAFARAAHERGLRGILFTHAECDVCDVAALARALGAAQPGDVVVNAAARLGTLEAERRPQPQFDVNVLAAINAAFLAQHRDAVIVHLSTDYVFDGMKAGPYVESDRPDPVNMYGALKLASEVLVRQANPKHFIIRISSVFGRGGSKSNPNFVDRILAQAADAPALAIDQTLVMSPTYALDAAHLALKLIDAQAPYGTYHGANAGACSWFEFAQTICDLSASPCRVLPRAGGDAVRRPANSSLDSERLSALGVNPRPWRDGLAAYLAERGAS